MSSSVSYASPKEEKLKIFQEIAAELGAAIEISKSKDVVEFTKGKERGTFYRYSCDLNPSGAQKVCVDKAETSERLNKKQIPHVEHAVFSRLSSKKESWPLLETYAKKHSFHVVCKIRRGQGGKNVFHAQDLQQLEKITDYLFKQAVSICICPFYEIQNEFRTVVLQHKAEHIFKKKRPQLHGNGTSTVGELLGQLFKTVPPRYLLHIDGFPHRHFPLEKVLAVNEECGPCKGDGTSTVAKLLGELLCSRSKELQTLNIELPLEKILPQGEALLLQWKHSAFLPERLDNQDPLYQKISTIASRATEAIGISFACVDVIDIKDLGLKVLEINSSVWLESDEVGYAPAKETYKKVVAQMLRC